MLQKALHKRGGVAILMAAILLTGCESAKLVPPPGAPPPVRSTADVTVNGAPKQLLAFDETFRSLIGSIGSKELGCSVNVNVGTGAQVLDCTDLQAGKEPPAGASVTYRFDSQDLAIFKTLHEAFNQVADLILTIASLVNAPAQTIGFCSKFKQPCYENYMCPNFGNCSTMTKCTQCKS
jgi:hypothetical protein